jgi:exocyst complex component 3
MCREYFEEVSQTRDMFEQTLWGHIRDFFNLAQER